MNPAKVRRDRLNPLTDLPNIGPAIAADLRLIGIHEPAELVGCDPDPMYSDLTAVTGTPHGPCVLDVFLSITCFINGEEPNPWWEFTAERKRQSIDQTND